MKLTDEILDELAAALVPKVTAISDVAWEERARPTASRHGWVEAAPTRVPDNGLGRTVCAECDQPLSEHSLAGGHPV